MRWGRQGIGAGARRERRDVLLLVGGASDQASRQRRERFARLCTSWATTLQPLPARSRPGRGDTGGPRAENALGGRPGRMQFAPAGLVQLHAIPVCRGGNAPPRRVALGIAHTLNLTESRHGIADVAGIFQGFLALRRKCKLARGLRVALFRCELGHGCSLQPPWSAQRPQGPAAVRHHGWVEGAACTHGFVPSVGWNTQHRRVFPWRQSATHGAPAPEMASIATDFA